MRFAIITLTALSSFGLLALSTPTIESSALPTALESETFAIDPVHSSAIFKIKHLDTSYFYGRFADMSGTLDFDSTDPSKCSLLIEIPAESMDSGNDKLDQHLRSPDFFDAKQFPVVGFKSTKVEAGEDGGYRVTGDFMLHGVTKSITVDVEHVGSADGRRGKMVGFHTTFTIDRTEYDMNYGVGGPLGSEVELTISIEAGKI